MATKFWIAAAFLIVSLFAAAESFWDGGAAIQKGDSAFESGFYVASNSFPVNTEVIVQNLETGKTVTAIVVGRIDDQGDLLVLLSPKVAAAIGISQGQVTPVRVTVKTTATAMRGGRIGDLPYSQDPDINPSAGMGKGSTTAAEAPQTVETPETAQQTAAKPPITEPQAAKPPETTEAAKPVEEKKPAAAAQPDDSVLQRMASRTPQKQLFFPPREDQKFAYQPPVQPPAEVRTAEKPKEPETTTKPAEDKASMASLPRYAPALAKALSVEMAEAQPPVELFPTIERRLAPSVTPPYREELALGTMPEPAQPGEAAPLTRELSSSVPTPPYREELALGEMPEPAQPGEEMLAEAPPLTQELSSPIPEPPTAPAEEVVIALEPTAPQPPPEKGAEEPPVAVALVPVEKPPVTPSTEKKAAPMAATVAKANYYLQLGAYMNEGQAKSVAASLPSSYPVSIVGPESPARPMFRIVLGPLNKAESGTLLYWFRDRGFPDAFIKSSL